MVEEEFKLIEFEIIRKLDSEKVANNFISTNLKFPKIRETAFEKAMSHKNFTEAEKLCIDGLSLEKESYKISSWLYKLYSVHETTKNITKMTEIAEKILLAGDLDYYDKLKLLLENQDLWSSLYSKLLSKCESTLPPLHYMKILAKEKEHALLLEQIKNHNNYIYTYGKLLAKKYKKDICEIFVKQINKEAESATDRKRYHEVCKNILIFKDAGFDEEVLEIINDFKSKNKRRLAFVDELNKISVL